MRLIGFIGKRVALILMVGCAPVAPAAAADAVYRCAGKDASVTFQDHPCSAGARERVVEITVKDPPRSEHPVAEVQERARPQRSTAGGRRLRVADPASYECRSESGLVFYRHSRCPTTIALPSTGTGKARRVTVNAQSMPRSEACRRMRNSARDGDELDEKASTYDRNLGRDICRDY